MENSTNSFNYHCPLCMDMLCEPVTLECKHSFCQFCLYQLLYLDLEKKKILVGKEVVSQDLSCPMCRKIHQFDISKLIVNSDLEKIIKTGHPKEYQTRLDEIKVEKENFKNQKIHHGKIHVGNRHTIVSHRNDTENIHKWSLFVESQGFDKEIIDHVDVTLHPTFHPSKIHLTRSPFEITRLGWGIFQIPIEITFKQECNLPPLKIIHMLSFEGDGDLQEHEIDYKTIDK